MHHFLAKEKTLSRKQRPDNRTTGRTTGQPAVKIRTTGPVNKGAVVNKCTVVDKCAVVNGRAVTMGEGGIEVIRRLSVCIHIQPLKKIQSSRGFYPPGLHLLCTIPDLDRLLGTLIETLVISCTIRCQFMTSLL